ncbi:MAG: sensor histidine kinase [Chloroflexota bacterium]
MPRADSDNQAQSLRDLRTLKIVGVTAPVVFVAGFEIVESFISQEPFWLEPYHFGAALVASIAAIVFGFIMFRLIEGIQGRVIRQNSELAAMNAMTEAVQGRVGVPDVVDAALRSVVDRTGAAEASVTMFPAPGASRAGEWPTRRYVAPGRPAGQDVEHGSTHRSVDIPLSTGTIVVGRLTILMSEDEGNTVSPGTLQSIGHQLACAIQMGQLVADLDKQREETSALYEVALQVTSQYALSDILGTIVRDARTLLAADDATICLSEPVSRAFEGSAAVGSLTYALDGTVAISPDPGHVAALHGAHLVCDVRVSKDYKRTLEAPLRGPGASFGDIWIGRRADLAFTSSDHDLLAALGDLAAIAISSARMHDNERHAAVLAERDRIAREMHDSLAQVLGVTHLRLRALAMTPAVAVDAAARAETTDLADLAEEAYRDVREAILGLRESSRVDRGLIESLHAFLEKYSRQSGIRAGLETRLEAEPSLAPAAEVQVIRVIQEALTNVRKHSGAQTATVRILGEEAATVFVVEDDGRGFDRFAAAGDPDRGYGLHTMRERMEQIGGTLTVDAEPGRGTRIIARVPTLGRRPAERPALEV